MYVYLHELIEKSTTIKMAIFDPLLRLYQFKSGAKILAAKFLVRYIPQTYIFYIFKHL